MHVAVIEEGGRTFAQRVCALAAFFLIAAPAHALDPSMANTQYGVRSWNSDDGLPQNSIVAAAQTPDGYLWFATEEGLARFDGVRFTTIIARRPIGALLVAHDGALWIEVDDVLARYKDRRLIRYPGPVGFWGLRTYSISERADGSIWIATESGLKRYERGKLATISPGDGSPASFVWTTLVASDGAVWYGTNGQGLKRLHRGVTTTFTTRDGLASNIVQAIQQDHTGDLWIGTNNGLSRMHAGKISTFPKTALTNQSVRAIREDRDRNVWIGTDAGLNRFSAGRFTSFGTNHPLSGASVLSLMEDREGSLWVGTAGMGLTQIRPEKLVTVGRSEGLPDDIVWSVREGAGGSLLIGTNHGFAIWKDGAMKSAAPADAAASDVVRSLLEDKSGGIWLGTNDGVKRYDPRTSTSRRVAAGLPVDAVRVVTEDRQGDVWIGTRGGGIVRWHRGELTLFNSKNGLRDDVIVCAAEDREGALWVGTNAGVSVMRDGQVTTYGEREGLSNNLVRAVYHDDDGGHWIGTYGGGLNRIKHGRIKQISMKDGLFDDVVFAIVEDSLGSLWMTCNHGLFRITLKELNDFADGKIARVHSTSFGVEDGMKAAECAGGSPGAWAGKNGRLYFATIKGVVSADPAHMPVNTLPPPVQIEEALLDGRTAPIDGGNLTIGSGKHDLEIRYTALSFIAPPQMAFRYRLRGFQDDWVDAGNRRSAFYTNLPPGQYTFEVMASNNDGVWNVAANPLSLELQAAFFQTLWFKIACCLLLAIAAWSVHKMRLGLVEGRERILAKRVDQQTAELIVAKEAALAEAEANTQLRLNNELILNSIADGVLAVDPAGIITLDNPAAAQMLGVEPEDLLGHSIREIIRPAAGDAADASASSPLDSVLAGGVATHVSDRAFWKRDGTSFPVDYLAAPIQDGNGRVTGAAVTFRDVTRQKEVERLKSEFVSTVSHELRTPLTSIRGSLALLSSGLLGTIDSKGQRMLQIAVTNTERLTRLINDILDLERIDSGTIELSRTRVDAGAVMSQAVDGVQSMADGAGVTLTVEPLREIVLMDTDRIIQTITNLLSNAIKFSPPGSSVSLTGARSNGEVVFRVADQGRGVPADKLETIFERFQQVDSSDSRKKGGTGLGLAICRSIVNAHGGKIWAESNVPNGCLFQFTLPGGTADSHAAEVA